VRNAPIVILDEPLTGLDAAAAAAVMEALERLMKDKTVVIVTHRLHIIQRAAQVAVLSAGRIVQQGTHRDLMEVDALYRKLFQAQFAEVMAP
jgi:ABC-type multidrug transport system fused ATPase/permease subunit